MAWGWTIYDQLIFHLPTFQCLAFMFPQKKTYQTLGPNLRFTTEAKKLRSILQKLLTQHLIYFFPKPPRKQLHTDFPSPAVPPPHVFCPSVPGWSARSVPNSPHQPCVACSLWAPWRSNISTLRIMRSQNWWFGDPCCRESNPSFLEGPIADS